MKRPFILSIAMLMAASATALLAEVPERARGFAGMVTGKVVSKGEDKVTLEVTAIAKTWKHSKAEKPESLVGKQVEVRIIPATYERKTGDYLARVRKFFSLMQVGESETLDVAHVEGDWLKFLELTEAQMKRIEEAK